MAIIKKLDEIIDLIPSPDYRLYGSNITEASSRIVVNNPLFAFIVNRKTKLVTGMFRVMFMLIKRGEKFHLLINDYNKNINNSAERIIMQAPNDRELKKTDWPFEEDEIGLRIDSDCYDKNIIYFGTFATDAKTVREGLNKMKEHEILTLEPVFI